MSAVLRAVALTFFVLEIAIGASFKRNHHRHGPGFERRCCARREGLYRGTSYFRTA